MSRNHNNKCFVPHCNTGYSSCKKKYSMFTAPKDVNLRKLWDKAICRADRKLSEKDVVCAKHFLETDIIKVWVSGDIIIPYKKPRLVPLAVPSIFSYSIPLNKSKNKIRERIIDSKSPKSVLTYSIPLNKSKNKIRERIKDSKSSKSIPTSSSIVPEPVNRETNLTNSVFEELWLNRDILKMPNTEWALHFIDKNEKRRILITECSVTSDGVPSFLRNMVIEQDLQLKLFFGTVEITKDTLSKLSLQPILSENISDIQNYVNNISNTIICAGGPSTKIYSLNQIDINTAKIDINGLWRHNSCPLILNGSDRRCVWCKRVYDYFINHLLSSNS